MAQETLTKAWKARRSYQAGTQLKAWLFTILRNECRFRGKSPTIPISNRPRFRNEIAHHSEMMSPAIPL
jgi:hypothetical protein